MKRAYLVALIITLLIISGCAQAPSPGLTPSPAPGGTANTQDIEARIHDYYDDPNLGKVHYEPIATSEIASAGPRG